MKHIILIQSGYKVECSPSKLKSIIKFLREDPKILTVDYLEGAE